MPKKTQTPRSRTSRRLQQKLSVEDAKDRNNTFFLSNDPKNWSYRAFRHYNSKFALEHPRHAFRSCLYQICKKNPPFSNFSQGKIDAADKLLNLSKIPPKPKKNFNITVGSNTTISRSFTFPGAVIGLSGAANTTRPDDTLDEDSDSESDSESEHAEEVSEAGNSEFSEDTPTPIPVPTIQLPSGFLLQGDIIFPFNKNVIRSLQRRNIEYLQETIPLLPKAPEKFNEFIELHAEFFSTHDLPSLPACPKGLTPAESDLWVYIHTAAMHFCRHFPKLKLLSLSHGEGWTDVNIWGHLIDKAFLYSESLSLDRKELQSITITTSPIPYFDGIIYNSSPSRESRFEIGFVEVKPARVPYPKSSGQDRQKTIAALKHALHDIRQRLQSPMKEILAIGVVCNGLKMTILQAWMPEFSLPEPNASDIVFVKEDHFELELNSVALFLETCWRVKMALENTFTKCQEATRVNEPL